MAGLTLATLFIPVWLLPWIAVIAAGALMLGARALAAFALTVLAVELLLVPWLAIWFETWPLWALLLMTTTFAWTVLHSLIAFLFGKESAGHFTGTMLVRLTDTVFFLPSRLLRIVFSLFRRG